MKLLQLFGECKKSLQIVLHIFLCDLVDVWLENVYFCLLLFLCCFRKVKM